MHREARTVPAECGPPPSKAGQASAPAACCGRKGGDQQRSGVGWNASLPESPGAGEEAASVASEFPGRLRAPLEDSAVDKVGLMASRASGPDGTSLTLTASPVNPKGQGPFSCQKYMCMKEADK